MTYETASAVYPVVRRAIGIAPEGIGAPGTGVSPTYTWPMLTFTPVDKITYLEDAAWRNAMAALYNVIPGVRIADVSLAGPFFGDGAGYGFTNILGDYWQAVNAGTVGTPTTLASSYTAGASTLSVTSNTGLTMGATFAVGTLGTTAEEVRTVSSITGSGPYTVTPNAPLYQNHASSAVVTPYSGVTTYTHNWALLNGGTGAGGWSQAQPRTHTITDYTGVTATYGARQYAYSCFSELVITSTPTGFLEWDGKVVALASSIPGSAPTIAPSTVAPQAAWDSTVTIAGSPVYNNSEWKLTLTRKLDPVYDNNGQRDPFAIPRGAFSASTGLNFNPAMDESELLLYLQNTQPTLVLTSTNGLSGANLITLTITANQAAFNTGAINDQKEVFGYDENALLVANTTNIGPSGGYSPLVISLINAVTNY